MADWLNTPLIVIVVIAVVGAIFAVGKWVGSVNTERSSFKEFIKEIREDIKKILGLLPPAPASASSPLTLTEYGEELSGKLGAVNWAQLIAKTVLAEVRGKQPFEIHNYCKDFVSKISSEKHPGIFKLAYENGITDEHMKIVLAIVLRDELFQRLDDKL